MKNQRICISLCEDSSGNILMGKRNDNGLWTVPGGHANKGECPYEAMTREFEEETGHTVKKLQLLKVERYQNLLLYLFKVEYEGEQDTSKDPDKECDSWEYKNPIEVADKLHVPLERNIALNYYMEN